MTGAPCVTDVQHRRRQRRVETGLRFGADFFAGPGFFDADAFCGADVCFAAADVFAVAAVFTFAVFAAADFTAGAFTANAFTADAFATCGDDAICFAPTVVTANASAMMRACSSLCAAS